MNFKLFRGYANFLEFETVQVQAGVRRLRATWTPETAQDLEAFHGIDVEAELTNLLSQQIAQEIDNEIMNAFLPIARNVAARTMGQELVQVQPMTNEKKCKLLINI